MQKWLLAAASIVKNIARNVPGFTLVELSVVLVIIGLIAGGAIISKVLLKSAEVRAQLTQIETYNHAVGMFKQKYDALPGDMTAGDAANFGFSS